MQLPKQPTKLGWRILKYLLIGSAAFFFVFIVTVWIVFEKKNDWLLHEIQSYINETQSGELKVGSMELSLIRSFPGVTIKLSNINFFEHRDSLRTINEQPILKAENFFIRLKLIPLLNEVVEISDVSLLNAHVNLEIDQAGDLNLIKALAPVSKSAAGVRKVTPKTKPKTSAPSSPKKQKPVVAPPAKSTVRVDLQHLEIEDVQINYHVFGERDTSAVLVTELQVDIRKEDSLTFANIGVEQNLQRIHLNNNTIFPGFLKLTADLEFDRANRLLNIQSTVNLEDFEASVTGTYNHQKNQYLDLEVDASANDLQLLSLMLSKETLKLNSDLLKQGDVYIKGKIVGEIANQLPKFDISIGARDLSWRSIHKNLMFENIGFDARFQSGGKPDFSEATLELRKLRGKLPGGSIKGDLSVTNFTNPVIRYDLDAHAKLDGYDEVFNLKGIKNLAGEVSIKAFFDGPLNLIATHQMDSSRSSSIVLKDLSFEVLRTKQQVSQLNASLITRNNQTIIKPFTLHYGENQVQLTATVHNLLYFLMKRSGLTATGKIVAPQLFTNDFLFDSLAVAQVQDRISKLELDFEISTVRDSAFNVPTLAFNIQNLTAKFDELPDISKVNTKGVWRFPSEGLRLDLTGFHGEFPQGKVDVVGDLFIPNRSLWKFNADLKLSKFPWTYIRELSAELRDNLEPSAKKMPVSEMDLLTGTFKTSASLVSYPFDITSLTLTGNKIQYAFPKVKPILADNLDLTLDQLLFKHPPNAGYLTGLHSTKGKLTLKKLDAPSLKMAEVQADISGTNDLLTLDIIGITRKSNQEQGKLVLDFSQKELGYHLNYEVKNADVKYFIQEFTKQKMVTGFVNYKLDLTTNGLTWENIKKNTAGKIEISSSNLHFYGLNIDKALRKYERSQNFNLTDIGAVVIAGPVGLAVTKGTEFVSLAAISTDSTQQTAIANLYARWDLNHMMLTTEDVAFTTAQNRIAFDGKIDFATNTVPGLTIAVVDKNGCSLMDQKLSGNFGSLKTGKLNITKTLLGSVINFVNAIVGKDCKPIYNGSVRAPESKSGGILK